jgi:hypothetical protein
MRIIVNGERRPALESESAGLDAGALLERAGAALFREGRLVTGVALDGADVTGQDREAWAARTDVAELRLATQTPRELLAGSLRVSREWLPPLRAELSGCAGRFRMGEDAGAIESLLRVVEGLRLLFSGAGQIQRLAAGLGGTVALGLPAGLLDDFHAQVPRLLDEIIQAQERRDWILLADLLEYDVVERLAQWEETVDTLLGALA